jgi:hypothetical protein
LQKIFSTDHRSYSDMVQHFVLRTKDAINKIQLTFEVSPTEDTFHTT